jgi:hypothetical protein
VRPAEHWSVADILDFESLLALDERSDAQTLAARDRSMFEKLPAEPCDIAVHDRRGMFHLWLDARRKDGAGNLPGRHFEAAWHLLLALAALSGIAVGLSVATGLLHYRGDEPVNVAVFLGWTVGIQFVLLAFALLAWASGRIAALSETLHPLQRLVGWAITAVAAGLRRLPGEQRKSLQAAAAQLARHRELYGSLAMWPAAITLQVFGVCFNIGVLAALLAHVAFTDVAFGWQSTLRTSPAEAFEIVRIIAAPWSGWLPHPHPNLEEIVGSRFVYSDGIQPLSHAALAAWWPFLCYAVVFYGLLIRATLLLASMFCLRRALRSVAFDHHRANALHRRLTGPLVHAGTAPGPAVAGAPPQIQRIERRENCAVLLAHELRIPEGEARAAVERLIGWRVTAVRQARIDHPSANLALFAELAAFDSAVVVVQAHRPPIAAIASFFAKLLAAAPGIEVVILLTGSGGASPESAEIENWRRFSAIHGLHIGIEIWRDQ